MTENGKPHKLAVKAILRSIGRNLPSGAKRSLLNGILDSPDRFEGFQQLGSALGVESISVRGNNGLAWGSLNDRWLLGSYALRREWASETVELFQSLFSANEGGTYLDIGANIGLTLFPIAQNPMVQCYGFEPEPRNFAYLNLGLHENCAGKNVVVKQLALFDRKCKIEFALSNSNFGDQRIHTAGGDRSLKDASRRIIVVSADRLDDILDVTRLKRPIAIKMDTQGAEPTIFSGGIKTIAATELLVLEFAPALIRGIGGNVEVEFSILSASFREAYISRGDGDHIDAGHNWRPIAEVVGEMRRFWADPATGSSYFDVVARR